MFIRGSAKIRLKIFRFGFALLVSLHAALTASHAAATDCDPDSGYSTCFEADNLWLTPSDAPFVSVNAGSALEAGEFSLGIGTSYLLRPVTLRAPSPDPDERSIRVVDVAFNTTLLLGVGVLEHLEATLATPAGLYQSGSGIKGITSQRGDALSQQALHDPRLGVSFAFGELLQVTGLVAKTRLELSLPLGHEDRFAGASGFVVSANVAGIYQHNRFFGGVELGARFRETVSFAGARIGNQLWTSLGVGFDVIQPMRLSVLAEAWALPSLVGQAPALGNRQTIHAALIPAEWLASVRSRLFPDKPWILQLGFGTGLPLSSETRATTEGEEDLHFLGVTTPEFRAVFVARYVPVTASKPAE